MKTGLFIDVSNLYHNVSNVYGNRKVDYIKYKEKIIPCIMSKAYGTKSRNEADSFIKKLSSMGFITKFIQVENQINSSLAVNICIDIIKALDVLEAVVIGSASREMIPLIKFLKENGIHVTVFACRIPDDIKNIADSVIEIEETHCETSNR